MFYFSHILAYGLYHTEKWASDYTQHGLVDALLQHIAKFILDAFSPVSSKTAFPHVLSQQRVVLTRSRGGQKPLPSAKRTCTIIFLNPNINLASFKITLDNQQGTKTQDDCFAQCSQVEQIQKDSSQLFPLLQTSCPSRATPIISCTEPRDNYKRDKTKICKCKQGAKAPFFLTTQDM